MGSDARFEAAQRASRWRYELGRLRLSAHRAAAVALLGGVVAMLLLGRSAVLWIPITFLLVTFTEWRGSFLMRGARRGIVAGACSLLLPLSILRPCCGVDARAMGETCCTMPSACWLAGALLGFAITLLLPDVPAGRRMTATTGVVLGMASVVVLRCSMLFAFEIVGLLGGIAASAIATTLARAWIRLRST